MAARFRDLPLLAQLGFGLTLFNSWIIFEETVVNRTSLSRLMPNYKVSAACVWDLGAFILIAGAIVLLRLRRRVAPLGTD